jgi:hypothetical protein
MERADLALPEDEHVVHPEVDRGRRRSKMSIRRFIRVETPRAVAVKSGNGYIGEKCGKTAIGRSS